MFLVILFAVLIVVLVAHLTMRRLFEMEIDAAFAGVGVAEPKPVDAAQLPPLVRQYAERAIAGSRTLPARIQFHQVAEMKLKPEGDWTTVKARQIVGIGAPGFAWDARVRMAPLIGARVIDAYVEGEGRLTVRFLGSIPMTNATGADVTHGELFRYLAELPWAPHAMLGNPALSWQQIDARTVEVAAQTAEGVFARVDLIFDETGDIVASAALNRPREHEGEFVPTRWRGDFGDYRDFDGVRLPAHAEVSWLLDDGPFTYFRGDIVSYDAGGAK